MQYFLTTFWAVNGSLGTQVRGSGDEEVYLLLSLEENLLIDPLFEK